MWKKLTPIEVYKTYLAFKNHFTKEKYDYFKYRGRSRASAASFNKRKDRYFFERMSRKKTEQEIQNFFLANFTQTFDPQGVWIGLIIDSGDKKYSEWVEHIKNLFETFKVNADRIIEEYDIEDLFSCKKGHSPILKEYLSSNLSIEEMIVYENIFSYVKEHDNKLIDPVWESVSLKIKKYSPFLNISMVQYKKHLIEQVQRGN